MTEQIHDWWSHLTPFEKAVVRFHEKEIDRKKAMLEDLRPRRTSRGKQGFAKTIARLELEINGHRQMRYEYQNRGTQRARLKIRPKICAKDRRRRHMDGSGSRIAVG